MATERENNIMTGNGLGVLSMRVYSIDGNTIRAFFDDKDCLIFVIDDTITPDKPNALLVIRSEDGRKWDDILANDYGVSLEMVRPKKDNKYQKLDIEYVGLDEYEDLIADYDEGFDNTDSLNVLKLFRADASRRAATERLQAAESVAENARETIFRAQSSIAEQQSRIKTLRSKLSQQKKSVGREPTKQSAAKILRTESQIDAMKDKLHRSQRRLDNARRRLVAAEEDAEIARNILARSVGSDNMDNSDSLPVVAPAHAVAAMHRDTDLPAIVKETVPATASNIEFLTEHLEPKAKEMAEEEVKPLFDKDPEILDEEIAFKPIDFDVKPVAAPTDPDSPRVDDYADPAPVAPLSFVPPTSDFSPVPEQNEATRPAPVLDTITAVEMPITPAAPQVAEPVVSDNSVASPQKEYSDVARPAPLSPAAVGVAAPVVGRPVSPMTGTAVSPMGSGTDGRKPSFLYYILLVALIILSIFTLWLYQKKNGENVPDLAATTVAPKEESAPLSQNGESPFIVAEEKVATTETPEVEPAPMAPAEQGLQPIPESVPEPVAPIVDETLPMVPVVVEPEPEPIPEDTPFLSEPEPEPEPVKPVVVNKPAYNAGSQNENMFVAGEDYDTDVVGPASAAMAPEYQEPVSAPQDITCDDGTIPSAEGCCGDEEYTAIGGGAYVCCSPASGECYPPLF